jgi:hypothetical protein
MWQMCIPILILDFHVIHKHLNTSNHIQAKHYNILCHFLLYPKMIIGLFYTIHIYIIR